MLPNFYKNNTIFSPSCIDASCTANNRHLLLQIFPFSWNGIDLSLTNHIVGHNGFDKSWKIILHHNRSVSRMLKKIFDIMAIVCWWEIHTNIFFRE